MSWSVLDIQTQIAIEIDQSSTAPTQGGTDWNIRLTAINRANLDWPNAYDWRVLHKPFNGIISTSTGNASLALPGTFKKLDSKPLITWDGSNTAEFPIIDISRNSLYLDSDKYVNELGNDRDGRTLYIHSTLVSGASIQFNFWASPVSLASATDITECPDPTYLVQRSLYYLYKGREDGRFPEAKVESEKILARMIENENTLGVGHDDNRVHNYNQDRGFRIGRD